VIQSTPLADIDLTDAIHNGTWNPPQHLCISPSYQVLQRGELAFLTNQRINLSIPKPLLSLQEIQVLRHIARGCSPQQTAVKLHISVRTVRQHLGNFKKKLNAKSRDHLMAMARFMRLVNQPGQNE
jgi:DNA-binding CsgD family transcriptional regulator